MSFFKHIIHVMQCDILISSTNTSSPDNIKRNQTLKTRYVNLSVQSFIILFFSLFKYKLGVFPGKHFVVVKGTVSVHSAIIWKWLIKAHHHVNARTLEVTFCTFITSCIWSKPKIQNAGIHAKCVFVAYLF